MKATSLRDSVGTTSADPGKPNLDDGTYDEEAGSMRIGYVIPEFPAQTHAFFWREVTALREEGHVVDIVSTTAPPRDACRHEFAVGARAETTYLNPPPVSVIARRLPALRLRDLLGGLRYVRECRPESLREFSRLFGVLLCAVVLTALAAQRRWDHVHVHSCADAAHLVAVARLLGGPPYSLTLHGDLPVYGRNHHLKMRGAAFVSTVTQQLRDQVIAETGFPLDRVPVICMGVDSERFARADRGSPDNSAGGGPLRLLTIARLNRAKGHLIGLKAMRIAKDRGIDLQYTIAGTGEELPAIKAEVDRLGLTDQVDLVGTLSENEVLSALRSADVFLLTSFGLGEAAPVAVMEAMACEVAVVASIIGGTPDMIVDGVDGFLVPQLDADAVAETIKTLSESAATRQRVGRRARETACAKFDYRSNARALAAMMK